MTGFVADLISVHLVVIGPTSLNISIEIYRHALSHILLSSYLLSCPFFSPLSSSYLPFLWLPVRAVIIEHALSVLVTGQQSLQKDADGYLCGK